MENSNVWTEKYRPQDIDEIVIDSWIREKISLFLGTRKNMHLIITGQQGIGKTTTVRCIARKTLGENLDKGYLELNAAEDRGVRSISNIVPPFCRLAVSFSAYKIILFDEADNLTSKCQHDIANLIKQFGEKTRFIFTCNDSTKIVEDIQSICTIINYKKMSNEQICSHLSYICEKEKIPYSLSGLEAICYIADGDMRRAINDLQKTSYTYRKISSDTVLSVCKVPSPDSIKEILSFCMRNNLEKANNSLMELIIQGYYYPDIITGFTLVLTDYQGINEYLRLELMQIVSQTKIIICTGLRSKLQLSGMLCRIIKTIQSVPNTCSSDEELEN